MATQLAKAIEKTNQVTRQTHTVRCFQGGIARAPVITCSFMTSRIAAVSDPYREYRRLEGTSSSATLTHSPGHWAAPRRTL